jgi:hypothetical protein
MRNGIPAAGLSELANEIKQHPAQGIAAYGVSVKWLSGTRSQASAQPTRVSAVWFWLLHDGGLPGGCICDGHSIGATGN